MKSHEAIQASISGNTVIHAKELHLSTSTVNKWQEPTTDYADSGAFNPLDRIEKIIETSLKLKIPRENALAPMQYLAQQFNCILLSIPTEKPTLKNISMQLALTVQEFGHLMENAAKAMDDGKISKEELKHIDREGHHLMHHLGLFLQMAQEAAE
jgi:hypothetical protein